MKKSEKTMIKLCCVVCDSELHFRWTDTHGVGVCSVCGTPYRILHYEDDTRVERPPECLLTPEGGSIARRYYKEADLWNEWIAEHVSELPMQEGLNECHDR